MNDLITIAQRSPLTRSGIGDLAKKADAATLAEAAGIAARRAGVPEAMALAFATLAAGGKLDPEVVALLLPEVFSLDHVGPLIYGVAGHPRDALRALYLRRPNDLELECYATLAAADALSSDPVHPDILIRARWLARHELQQEPSMWLGGAAARLGDRDLLKLAAPHVNRAKRAKRALDETLAIARRTPLEALSNATGSRVASGFTVKHEGPTVGRNDPCPCGSGKKYKKCHANAEQAPASAEARAPDPTSVGAEQAALLRPFEIERLETRRLPPKSFIEAFKRVVDGFRWDLALRLIEESKAPELDKKIDTVSLVIDAFETASKLGHVEDALRFHALLPPDEQEREALSVECLQAPPDLLAKIEQEAHASLKEDADGARGMIFAATLLRHHPNLGIYVARGALNERRLRDSRALIQGMEDARDRTLLPPFEAWWDVYDAAFEPPEDRRAQAKDDAKREKMKEDLRKARAASRKSAAELEKLQRLVSELDAKEEQTAKEDRGKETTKEAAAPSEELAAERRRLKTKIDELQRIIGEGQEERRDLRRQLAEREDEEESAPSDAGPRSKDPDREDEEDEDRHESGGVDMPRGVLVPRFSDRAAKAVTDLAGDMADSVFTVIAGLAAGKPNAWGGVKQLTKVRGIFSARATIHYRILFTIGERALEILEVLHRKDLEQVVTRLARVT